MNPDAITRDADGKQLGVMTGMGIHSKGPKRTYNKTGKYRREQASTPETAKYASSVRSNNADIRRRVEAGKEARTSNEGWKCTGGRWKRQTEAEFTSPYKKQVVTKRITEFFGYVDNTKLEHPNQTDVIDLTESTPRSPIGAENLECLDTIVNI